MLSKFLYENLQESFEKIFSRPPYNLSMTRGTCDLPHPMGSYKSKKTQMVWLGVIMGSKISSDFMKEMLDKFITERMPG